MNQMGCATSCSPDVKGLQRTSRDLEIRPLHGQHSEEIRVDEENDERERRMRLRHEFWRRRSMLPEQRPNSYSAWAVIDVVTQSAPTSSRSDFALASG
jgi:hypothetical protein